mgnify:CR=1 FL=1
MFHAVPEIEQIQSFGQCHPEGLTGAGTGVAAVIRDAGGGMLHHVPVAFLHTRVGVEIVHVDHAVRASENLFVAPKMFQIAGDLFPAGGLVAAGKGEDEFDIGVEPCGAQDFHCGKRVEAESAARYEITVAGMIEFLDAQINRGGEVLAETGGDDAVPGKAAGLFARERIGVNIHNKSPVDTAAADVVSYPENTGYIRKRKRGWRMKYICDTGDEKLDAMLRALLESFRDSADDGILLVTENPAAADERYAAVIVLYTNDRYTYSEEHRALAQRYGEKYRAVLRPIDIAGFWRVVREMSGGAGYPAPVKEEEDGGVTYENRTVSFRGRTVKLTAREDELFRLMYEHRGKVVSRERIAAAVWGSGTSTNVTDVYMSYLRKKLVTVFGDGVLSSVRGEGYILKMPSDEEIIGTR